MKNLLNLNQNYFELKKNFLLHLLQLLMDMQLELQELQDLK
jgi:hypothetical protein